MGTGGQSLSREHLCKCSYQAPPWRVPCRFGGQTCDFEAERMHCGRRKRYNEARQKKVILSRSLF